MSKKTLSVKIPIEIAKEMDDRAELNAPFITDFLSSTLEYEPHKHYSGLVHSYSMKVSPALHKQLKYRALDLDLTLSDLTARLFETWYWKIKR